MRAEAHEHKHLWEPMWRQKTRAVADRLLEAQYEQGEETKPDGDPVTGGPPHLSEFHLQDLKPMVTVCVKENLLGILAREVVKESFLRYTTTLCSSYKDQSSRKTC